MSDTNETSESTSDGIGEDKNVDQRLYELEYAKRYYFEASYNLELKIELLAEIAGVMNLKPLVEHMILRLPFSKAQLIQDLLASFLFTKKGYFVEFGASDGKIVSNTYYLEKELGWDGILAEPSLKWIESLENNRNCNIEKGCVYSQSDLLVSFKETEDGLLSTISDYADSDLHADLRRQSVEYEV